LLQATASRKLEFIQNIIEYTDVGSLARCWIY